MKEYKPHHQNENTQNENVVYRKKYRNHWGRAFIMLFVILGICFFLAFFGLASVKDLFGLEKKDKQIEVTITDDMKMSQITKLLHEKNVIEQPFTFSLYAKLKKADEKLKSGTYILNSNMGYDQIIYSMRGSKNAIKDTVKVTFYEGMTIREIGDRLEENKVCTKEDFINALDTGTYDYDFVSRIPADENRFRKFEGYLFPDTYEFYVGMDPQSVVKKFLTNFQNKLSDDLNAQIKNSGMSLDQVITLASIIQEEASAEEEMGKVSSVFHNRMDSPETFPKLQSDVTIFYVEKDIKPFLNEQNQALYDSYNTYVCKGLPVAPVSNPGLAAIEAALNPENTDFYFFLTDINGKYYYAKTAQEHYQNDYTASKLGKTHGISMK